MNHFLQTLSPRGFGLSGLVWIALVAAAVSPALAATPDDMSFALVGAEGSFLWAEPQTEGEGPTMIQGPAESSAAVSVAADLDLGIFWLARGKGLSARSVDGSLLFEVPLDARGVAGDAPRHLVVHETDGTLWLGAGNRLWNVTPGGQVLRELTVEGGMIVDLDLDSATSELWITSPKGALAVDAVTGASLREVKAPSEEPLVASALVEVETVDGEAETEFWTTTGGRLVRFTADGKAPEEQPLPADFAIHQIVADGSGGVWLAAGTRLGRMDASGALTWQSPFGDETELTAMSFHGDHRSLWIAGGGRLVEIGRSGWPLGSVQAVGISISDLAVIESAVDEAAPVVSFLAPEAGSTVDDARPEIHVAYSDEGSGVLAGSLVFTRGGAAVDADCAYSREGATCGPTTPFADGEVTLEVTVADAAGNVSAPASVTFTVDTGASDGDDDSGGANQGGLDPEHVYTPAVNPRGIRPNQPYSFGEIDAIDTASGNVTFRIPLGQVFEAGPFLRYQFMAVNNSNAWDFIQIPCQPQDSNCDDFRPSTFAMPNAGSNAGLGWEVHFGKLYAFDPPTGLSGANLDRWPNRHLDPTDFDGKRWLYVAPDGARHTLHSLPGRDNGTLSQPKRYSRDGSFLRMHQTSASEARVEFPNGTYSVFEKVGAVSTGTDFCGTFTSGNVSGCWRFKEMRDRYGNNVSITYFPPQAPETIESWQVNDSTGRSSVIRFDTSDAATAGNDGNGTFQTEEGDEWGDLRRVVTRVQVAKFGSGTANYDFTYINATVGRSCPPNTPNPNLVADQTIATRVLTQISVPDSQPYKFITNTSGQTTCSNDDRGKITEVTLPTRGKLSYVYASNWKFPTTCNYGPNADEGSEITYLDRGIFKKIRKKPDGTDEGTWTYSNQLVPDSGLDGGGANCTRADYRVTTVDGPTFDGGKYVRTQSYHTVHQGDNSPSSSDSGTAWQVTDQGLPFTKEFDDGGTGLDKLFLSSVTSFCANANCDGAVSEVTSRTYRRYVSEYRSCNKLNGLGDSASCYQVNAMQRAERTVYPTDGNRYIWTTRTDYDGAGHFRDQTMEDFFDGTTTRTTSTNYTATGVSLGINSTTGYVNVGTPSSYLPSEWILTPYDKVTKTDGSTYVTDVVFDDKGSVICTRDRKNSGSMGAKDRVVKFTLGTTVDDAGLPITEEVSGGETADLPTDSACDRDTSTTEGQYYKFDHTYEYLQLASTRIGTFPYRYRADIDQNTGLPSKIYNEADEAETLTFDSLGRLTLIEPDASRNEADTEYVYANPAGSNPSMTMKRLDGTTELTREKTIYDHFGREIVAIRANPFGATGDYESKRVTEYDNAGHVIKKTTRQRDNSDFNDNWAWTYADFNVYGQPETITAPDGQVTDMDYFGVRAERLTVSVQTPTGPRNREILTVRDALKRTVNVNVQGAHDTTYGYDPNGKMVSVTRAVPSPGVAQVRSYQFDARGYLLSASLPEVTGNGGKITYKPDAIGLSWQTKDGEHDLTWSYDGNGRPLSLSNTTGGLLWKEWTYGTSNTNGGDNKAKGRLIEAIRYNYPPVGEDVAILESYEHESGTAGPSKATRQIRWLDRAGNAQWGARFSTTMDYDLLGNSTSLGYPTCIANTGAQGGAMPCNDGGDVPAPPATGTWTYNEGLMRTATLSLGPTATYNYHHNLQVADAMFGNGVIGAMGRGTNGMARPARYQVGVDLDTVYWDSGAYGYDEAGNIKSIGDDLYTYDAASRLRSATVMQAGAGRTESYVYNTTDSMIQVTNDQFGTRPFNVSTVTNRLLGVGATTNNWTYDGAGNTLSALGGSITFSWDGLNKLNRYKEGSKDFVSIYGPGDFRVWVEDRSTGTKYWTSRGPDGKILREFEITANGGTWEHIRDFVYGAQGVVASVDHDGTQFYYHSDHLATPRLKTNAAGRPFSYHHYYPFGLNAEDFGLVFNDGFESGDLLRWEKDTDVLSVKFTGHERERHGNLDYMLGRHYAFVTNRFLSVDPARDGWNLYTYVGNNPMGNVDPMGLLTAAAISYQITQNLTVLKQDTTTAASDGSLFGVVEATVSGATFDLAIGFVDLFTVGASTGDAIGSGADGLDVALAIGGDTLRLSALVAPFAAGARQSATRRAVQRAEELHPTFRPGPYAGESIPARSRSQRFTTAEREEINRIGSDTGCHTCGSRDAGTTTGNFVPDHQPVSSLNMNDAPQRLYPQCIHCSREQGLAAARAARNQQ